MSRPVAPGRTASIAGRWRDFRYERWMHRVLKRALTPPLPSEFGAFGRSVIVPPARVNSPQCIFIGDGVVIHEGVWLSVVQKHDDVVPRLSIGDRTRIGRFCQISCVGEIVIGEDVLISDQVQIGDTFHEYKDVSLPSTKQPMARPRTVEIGSGSLLSVGCVILPGVRVGAGAYVREGSVVTRDVAPGRVVGGNPAAIIEHP